ncbi:MAG: hypothetical protein RL685_4592 [Pseudomonadota bacterium]|jgi:hypothetical protein
MPVIGDLQLSADGREILLTSGAAMALQQIKVGAQIWTGTIGWDPDAGLPMLGTILVKGPDFRVITQIFRSFLLSTAGVESVDELTVKLDRATRTLSVQFRVTCEDGESAADEVSFAIA